MPTGAFSYSHGLEWAVEAALVHDAPGLHGYVEAVLRQGSGRVDAILLGAAYGASIAGNIEGPSLEEVIALSAAMHGTRELALESAAQGRALLITLQEAWPAPELDQLDALCGRLEVEPQEIALLPRGLRYRVTLANAVARGYVCENFGQPLRLPELGPIGSNGLALLVTRLRVNRSSISRRIRPAEPNMRSM